MMLTFSMKIVVSYAIHFKLSARIEPRENRNVNNYRVLIDEVG
jgi:hypothetical protein